MDEGEFMAYFLKKTRTKTDTYLQIYESYYDPARKGGAHRSIRAIGYVKKLTAQGIDDPITFFQKEVDEMNAKLKKEKQQARERQIGEESPERLLGYFPFKNINDGLSVKRWIDLMQSVTGFRFNVYDMIASLIYARVVQPCSKARTYDEVLPRLYEPVTFSLNQLYDGLEYIGQEYEKIIEIYNEAVASKYKMDTAHTYFDCTNFYFEIDREDDFRRKGPSKENRRDPIVGLGLLLDGNQIPIGMHMYPGNESEKPVLRQVIDSLKARNHITGRTIQVADKGLNCAENILHARRDGDGYIFSKSVKQLPEKEKTWVLLESGYCIVKDKEGKELYRIKECVDEFPYTYVDASGKKAKIMLTEKRVVTYNPQLAKKKLYEIDRQVEKARKLCAASAKRDEFGDSAKYVYFQTADKTGKATNGKVTVSLNEDAVLDDKRLAGYNLIVTSETQMPASQIYAAYHNLWRIEESFRVMKSQLDARPVFLQKVDTIKGHFLICYLSVLLLRLFQFKILDNQYCTDDIIAFVRDFRIVKISDRKAINMARSSPFISSFAASSKLKLTAYFLLDSDIRKMLSHRF